MTTKFAFTKPDNRFVVWCKMCFDIENGTV